MAKLDSTDIAGLAIPYRYRIVARYRQWIGKPDPSNAGEFTVASDDPTWIHDKAAELSRRGHKVYKIQRFENGAYRTI